VQIGLNVQQQLNDWCGSVTNWGTCSPSADTPLASLSSLTVNYNETSPQDANSILIPKPVADKAMVNLPYMPTTLANWYTAVMTNYPGGYRYIADNMFTSAPAAELLPGIRRIIETMPPHPSHFIFTGWNSSPDRADKVYGLEDEIYMALYTVCQVYKNGRVSLERKRLRLEDLGALTSAWSGARCVAIPLDDPYLTASRGWARLRSSTFWSRTASQTSARDATLTRSDTHADRLSVVATTCKHCGTIGIYLNSALIRKVNLYSASTHVRHLFVLPTFKYRSGTVLLKVLSSAKPVQIDGLGMSRA
jgi:hypothetical protein